MNLGSIIKDLGLEEQEEVPLFIIFDIYFNITFQELLVVYFDYEEASLVNVNPMNASQTSDNMNGLQWFQNIKKTRERVLFHTE